MKKTICLILAFVAILIIACSNPKIITDIDGNVYKTVKIGKQVWMAENLKTTKYRNGDLIGTTTITVGKTRPDSLFKYYNQRNKPKCQWAYDGNESNAATYGRLYTWYVVTDNRNVCPSGWHIPSNAEWTTLYDYLTNNGYGYHGHGGNIGKSIASTSGWTTTSLPGQVGNDQTSNNSSGFTGLPAGYSIYGGFSEIGNLFSMWSSTEADSSNAFSWEIIYNLAGYTIPLDSLPKFWGSSVRCLKDTI
jgi:uncharacterized protein (TIGR02145 family)